MKWWFGTDDEDDMPAPKLNGEHGLIWDAIKFVHKGQRIINKRLVRIEILVALGVAVALLALGAQFT